MDDDAPDFLSAMASPKQAAPAARSRMAVAYERTLPRLMALAAQQLSPVNLDVPTVVVTILGVVPGLAPLRAAARTLPGIAPDLYDDLETHALAAAHAHSLRGAARRTQPPPPELVAELTATRALLLTSVRPLIVRGHLHLDLSRLRGPTGYANLTTDVFVLCAALRDRWPHITGRTDLELPEIEHAESLAARLSYAAGRRAKLTDQASTADDMQRRAFTLALRTYDEVRRTVAFLRWHDGDAETFAPSLWAHRGGRGRREQPRPSPGAPSPVAEGGDPAAADREPDPGADHMAVRPQGS